MMIRHLPLLLASCCLSGPAPAQPPPDLWDPGRPFPLVQEIPAAAGVEFSFVHEQTPDFLFLHEPRLAFHGETLFVSFSHAPVKESEPEQRMHGRRSMDGGRTWGPLETIAPARPGAWRTETAALLSHQGKLWAFVGRYAQGEQFSKNSLGMEMHRLNAASDKFELVSENLVLENFVPFVLPQRLANGNWIIGGHTDKVTHAAVAISKGDDLRQWHCVRIETPQPPEYPETSLIHSGNRVVAIIRQARQPELREGRLTALVAESTDSGETFTPAQPSNLPMQNSKPFSGVLSTGQHYLIFNAATGPYRNTLLIAVTRPGELLPFRKVFKVVEGHPEARATDLRRLGAAGPTHHWAYPEAVEKEDALYVTFSLDKRHCVLARVPVSSLAAK